MQGSAIGPGPARGVFSVTVMLGGPSEERDVSLRSGAAVARALRSLGHQVEKLDPRDEGWELSSGTDVVFLALHGTYGEDGQVQRRLERMGIPFTGCDSESSRIAFDKVLTKERLLELKVPTARYGVFRNATDPWPEGWTPPVILKPVRQGSSVGLKFVDQVEDWPRALAESLRYDSEVLMEERILGRELTVGILEGRPLPIVEVRPKQGAYDYQNKYTAGATEYFCPAALELEVAEAVRKAGLDAFEAVGGRDYGRVDVMLREDGRPVVLEVNTLPGMTATSLFPKAAAAAGLEYPALCQRMIELALERSGRGVRSAAV